MRPARWRRTGILLTLFSLAAISCSNDFSRFHFVQSDRMSDASAPDAPSRLQSDAEDGGAHDHDREGTSE